MSKKAEQPDPIAELTALERLRVAPMGEVEQLSGLSQETIRRHHADRIIQLSPRRQGMRVQDALMIRAKNSKPP